jgi:capsular exopolysaccharide synthesis family protein
MTAELDRQSDDGSRERDALSSALAALRRRWLLIVAIVLVCMGAAFARHHTMTKSYDATANVTFGSTSLSDAALQINRGSGDAERDAATNVLVARSPEVAGGVRRELGTTLSSGQLASAVSVQAAPNANVLNITAKAEDPAQAARLANAFADQYIAFGQRSQIASIDQAERDLRSQLDALPADSPERSTLQASLQRLGELRAVANGGAQIIGRAAVPDTPSGMSLRSMLILGAIIGLAIAMIVVFLLEALDRRVNSIDELEREYGLTALAAVPQTTFRGRKRDRDEQLEPYRILRSSLDFVGATRQLETLLITSAVPQEGKTTVAVELAHAVALAGRRVVLVELDLRRPTFSRHFDVDPARGITSALTRLEPVDAVVSTPIRELPNLSVVSTGMLPPNPAELLGAQSVADALTELTTPDGLVIIDAPPLIPVADAQILLDNPAIQAALVVARLGHTTREEVRRARAILDRHMLQPVGLVVTGLREPGRYGYSGYRTAAPTLDNGAVSAEAATSGHLRARS